MSKAVSSLVSRNYFGIFDGLAWKIDLAGAGQEAIMNGFPWWIESCMGADTNFVGSALLTGFETIRSMSV